MNDVKPEKSGETNTDDMGSSVDSRSSAHPLPSPRNSIRRTRNISSLVGTLLDKAIPKNVTSRQLATWSTVALSGAFLAVVLRWIVGATYLQPAQGAVLGGIGVLAAGSLTYYASHRTRVSNESIAREATRMAEIELKLERDKLETTNRREDEQNARTHRRELERDLRSRFTTSAAQLADPSPTIRLAGVFSLIALADDWDDAENRQQRDVCVEVLKSYLTQPQVDPTPDDERAVPFLHVRRRIALTLHARRTMEKSAAYSWSEIAAASLEEVDLRHVNLDSTDLRGANLRGAKLSNASFFSSDLRDTNFNFADMFGAKLTLASLQNASLSYAELRDADLGHALLSGAKLEAAKLQGARLDSADLRHADLNYAVLEGTDLESANLTGAMLGDIRYDNTTTWPDNTHTPPPEVTTT